MGKILSIEKKVPKECTLPDGFYVGTWGGSVIEVYYNGETYVLRTEAGIRGFGFKVVVKVFNGVATFEEGLKN